MTSNFQDSNRFLIRQPWESARLRQSNDHHHLSPICSHLLAQISPSDYSFQYAARYYSSVDYYYYNSSSSYTSGASYSFGLSETMKKIGNFDHLSVDSPHCLAMICFLSSTNGGHGHNYCHYRSHRRHCCFPRHHRTCSPPRRSNQ